MRRLWPPALAGGGHAQLDVGAGEDSATSRNPAVRAEASEAKTKCGFEHRPSTPFSGHSQREKTPKKKGLHRAVFEKIAMVSRRSTKVEWPATKWKAQNLDTRGRFSQKRYGQPYFIFSVLCAMV